MPDVTTAGNFAAAVLEQAGYIAQAQFLKDFRDFFREAGALVYILGGIGGVISMVVFGSFRAARYLLIGPALYWFLIGPTTTFDGVVWQVGGGQPRGLNGTRGEGASQQYVNRALTDSRLSDGGGEGIEVAMGFALFARVINTVTRDLADLILGQDEDNEYLLYLSKGIALDMLVTGMPEDPYFTEMMEGDFVAKCSDMFGYGLARASYDLRDDVLANAGAGADVSRSRQQYYQQEFEKYKNGVYLNPNGVTRAYLRAAAGGSTNESAIPSAVSCQQMWQLVASYLSEHARAISKKILEKARGDQGDANLACQRLMEKISGDGGGGGGCDLQNVVALYMLKNAVYDRRSLGRFVKRITDSVGEPKAVQDGSMIPLNEKVDDRLLSEASTVVRQVENDQLNIGSLNPRQEYLFNIGMGERVIQSRAAEDPAFLRDKQAQQNARQQFQTVARLSAIGGPLDAGFTEFPKYHLRNIRQQLFTWSMHLPYWQGVLLYIIAVAYPFMALIVLLPGRAVSFLNVPLAWLWVKSWDVGFAIVMVFERVLWNILPSLNVANDVATTPLQNVDMWRALSEAEKFDHTWNLHMYYICLAFATFSIPVITGYATMRSRRAVLASFTDKMQADARDAGQLAAGAWGVQVMADRVRMITELQGAAARIASSKGVGYESSQIGASAEYFGNMAAVAKIAERAPEFLSGKNFGSLKMAGLAPEVISDALAEKHKVKAEFLAAEVKYQQEFDKVFHPVLGRYGTLAVQNEAYAAAMDGSGGFEMNVMHDSPIDDFISLHNKKIEKLYEYHGRIASALPGAGALLAPYEEVRGADGVTHTVLNPARLTDSVPEFIKNYGVNELIRNLNQYATDHPGLGGHSYIGSTAQLHEFDTSRGAMERVFGLSAPINQQIQETLNNFGDPKFTERYTYHRDEMFAHLPDRLRQALEAGHATAGTAWSGVADGALYHAPPTPIPSTAPPEVQAPIQATPAGAPAEAGASAPVRTGVGSGSEQPALGGQRAPAIDTGASYQPVSIQPGAYEPSSQSLAFQPVSYQPVSIEAPRGADPYTVFESQQPKPVEESRVTVQPVSIQPGAYEPSSQSLAFQPVSYQPVSIEAPRGADPYTVFESQHPKLVEEARATLEQSASIDRTDPRYANRLRNPDANEKGALAALSMEWLTGDTEEMQERERMARHVTTIKPVKPSRKGIA